jgi:hypothetical protein
MFISLLLILISIPLIISHSALNEAVCESKLMKWLLFEWLGCKKEAFEQHSFRNGHNRTALPLGLILCVLSWWIRPIMLFTLIGVFIFATTVFYIPETGIVALVLMLPFLSYSQLSIMIIYITVCFLMKYIRGKRTIKFDPLAVAVLAYLLLVFYNTESFWHGVLGGCIFFLVINLIKSKKWINRTLTSFSLSFFLSVIYGLILYVSARFGIDYLTYIFDSADVGVMESVFLSPTIFASYIVTVLPIIIAKKQGGKGTEAFLGIIAGCVCLFLTGEYRAWISLILAVVFYLVFFGKRGLAFIGIMLFVLPFVFINIPMEYAGKIFDGKITNNIQSVLFKEIHGHIDVFFTASVLLFIGVMFLCLQKNITLYSRGCSSEGRRVSLGAMAGLAAFLYMGNGVVIAVDFKLSIIFWILLGIASCVSETERSNALYNENEELGYGKGELI